MNYVLILLFKCIVNRNILYWALTTASSKSLSSSGVPYTSNMSSITVSKAPIINHIDIHIVITYYIMYLNYVKNYVNLDYSCITVIDELHIFIKFTGRLYIYI